MPFNLMNLVVAKAVLERDKVITDPDKINQTAMLAALIPGPMGLILPLAVERNEENKDPDDEPEEDDGGKGDSVAVRKTLAMAVAKLDSMEQSMKAQLSNLDALPTHHRIRELEESLTRRMDALDKLLADQIKALPETPKSGTKATT